VIGGLDGATLDGFTTVKKRYQLTGDRRRARLYARVGQIGLSRALGEVVGQGPASILVDQANRQLAIRLDPNGEARVRYTGTDYRCNSRSAARAVGAAGDRPIMLRVVEFRPGLVVLEYPAAMTDEC